ncbi:hypothetical protein [Ectopseudomonas guguanensis]|uniref:hypothetical protein n=1 Tax=Ectopseudomonas guguanensis TaxID=1198456 RepID=UPI0028AA3478|nr:hypothetical protein [Pseudomonas guguanensis]
MIEQKKMDPEGAAFEAWYAQDVGVTAERVKSWRFGESYREEYEGACSAWKVWQARASLPVGVPDGWKLVPVDPTPEMIQAALDKPCFDPLGDLLPWTHITRTSYAAMLAAAPTVKPSFADDPRKPHELSAAGCRCVRFGEGNPRWPCPIHAAPTVKAEQVQAMPQEWWQIIHDTLRDYRMSTLGDGEGGGYPLIDAMTADGQSVAGGIEECTYLADAIWNALPTQAPSLPAAGSAYLTAVRCQCCAAEYPHDSYDAGFIAGSGMCQVCDADIPAVDLPSAAPAEQPYPHGIAEDLERSDWAPLEALQWYAAGNHFDVADGRTRIIDTGAVASNALKHASLAYLELKGDAELSELRAALSAQKSAHVSVPECKLGIRGRAYDAPSVCRAYTYTEQPNNDHAWKLGKAASAVKAGGDYIDAGLSLLEQLQANGFGVFELRALLNGGEA